MPIFIRWDDPDKTIIRQTYDGNWDVSDMHKTFDEIQQMRAEVNHPINIIADMSYSRLASGNVLTVLSRAERIFLTEVNIAVVIGANSYLKALTNIATRLAPKALGRMHFANNVEEAYTIIERYSKVEVIPES